MGINVTAQFEIYKDTIITANSTYIPISDGNYVPTKPYILENDLLEDLFVAHFRVLSNTISYSEILESSMGASVSEKIDYIDRDICREDLHHAYLRTIAGNNLFKDKDFLDTSEFHEYTSLLLESTRIVTEVIAKLIYKCLGTTIIVFNTSRRTIEE